MIISHLEYDEKSWCIIVTKISFSFRITFYLTTSGIVVNRSLAMHGRGWSKAQLVKTKYWPNKKQKLGKDGSTGRTRLRVTPLRIQQHPAEARYHRAEVGRGVLMDGVTLEQTPRVPTTEEDAARPNAGKSHQSGARWPRISASLGRGTPSSGRISGRSVSAPAAPVGGATAELSCGVTSSCSRTARSRNLNRPSCGQKSGGRPRSGKGKSRCSSSLLKRGAAQLCWTS